MSIHCRLRGMKLTRFLKHRKTARLKMTINNYQKRWVICTHTWTSWMKERKTYNLSLIRSEDGRYVCPRNWLSCWMTTLLSATVQQLYISSRVYQSLSINSYKKFLIDSRPKLVTTATLRSSTSRWKILMQTLHLKNLFRRMSELDHSLRKIKSNLRARLTPKMMKMRMRRSSILRVFMKLRCKGSTRRNVDARRRNKSCLKRKKRI